MCIYTGYINYSEDTIGILVDRNLHVKHIHCDGNTKERQ